MTYAGMDSDRQLCSKYNTVLLSSPSILLKAFKFIFLLSQGGLQVQITAIMRQLQSTVIKLVRCFEKSVNSGDLIDERNILSECEMWGSGRLRKICAIKWICII